MDLFSPSEEATEAPIGEMSPFAAEVLAKQPFRGYQLLTPLASGERTAVFRARDLTMERSVAVKVLRPCRERDGAVEEFFSLAGSIARLRCPGVARGLDAGRGDGDFFLVYEFARGENLADRLGRLQTGRIAEKDSLRVVAGVAGVLQRLFEHGHPHGNLKPSNIIQGEGGAIKLTDIGFAWTMAWPDDAAAFCASPDYLPPERIAGEINVDIRGDLYSLGAVWYHMLMGAPVFRAESPEEVLRMHLETKPFRLHRLDEKIGEASSVLVGWLLEKDRDQRPRTPKEFLRRLAEHPLMAEGTPSSESGGEFPSPPATDTVSAVEEVGGMLGVEREVEMLIRESLVESQARKTASDAESGADGDATDAENGFDASHART